MKTLRICVAGVLTLVMATVFLSLIPSKKVEAAENAPINGVNYSYVMYSSNTIQVANGVEAEIVKRSKNTTVEFNYPEFGGSELVALNNAAGNSSVALVIDVYISNYSDKTTIAFSFANNKNVNSVLEWNGFSWIEPDFTVENGKIIVKLNNSGGTLAFLVKKQKPTPTPTRKPTVKPMLMPTPVVNPKSAWKQYENNWYYYDAKGYKVKGWNQIDGSWYFFDSKGVMQTGWIKDGGKWYYMNASGSMVTGWIQNGGKWYFMSASGAMATGWVHTSGKWYFMSASGAMATGWVQSDGKWYYMGPSGAMVEGWVKYSNCWYYMGRQGAMVTGWFDLGDKHYYFEQSGQMVTGSKTINGKTRVFDSNGELIK